MKCISVIILLVLGIFQMKAQSSSAILDDIRRAYQGDFTVTVDAVYRYHPEYNSQKVTDSLKSILVMHGDDYYFRIGEMEFMRQGNYYIVCDRSNKQIAISKDLKKQNHQSGFMLTDLLQQNGIEVTSSNNSKNEKHITLHMQGNQVEEVDLIIDQNNYVQKSILKYQEDIDWKNKKGIYSKLEITYGKPVKNNKPFPAKLYGLERFIQNKPDGEMQLTSSYSHFALTDNTH